jgi:hypothetical protein
VHRSDGRLHIREEDEDSDCGNDEEDFAGVKSTPSNEVDANGDDRGDAEDAGESRHGLGAGWAPRIAGTRSVEPRLHEQRKRGGVGERHLCAGGLHIREARRLTHVLRERNDHRQRQQDRHRSRSDQRR